MPVICLVACSSLLFYRLTKIFISFYQLSQESKLNPGAKIFSPALTKPVPATPPLVRTGMSYVHSASPLLPVAAAQAEVGTSTYVPQPSVPAKVVQYNNFTAGNGDIGAISQAVSNL